MSLGTTDCNTSGNFLIPAYDVSGIVKNNAVRRRCKPKFGAMKSNNELLNSADK